MPRRKSGKRPCLTPSVTLSSRHRVVPSRRRPLQSRQPRMLRLLSRISSPHPGDRIGGYPRVKCFVAVELRVEGSDTPLWGNVSNTSMGGCLAECPGMVEPGKSIEIGLWVANGTLWIKGIVLTESSRKAIPHPAYGSNSPRWNRRNEKACASFCASWKIPTKITSRNTGIWRNSKDRLGLYSRVSFVINSRCWGNCTSNPLASPIQNPQIQIQEPRYSPPARKNWILSVLSRTSNRPSPAPENSHSCQDPPLKTCPGPVPPHRSRARRVFRLHRSARSRQNASDEVLRSHPRLTESR